MRIWTSVDEGWREEGLVIDGMVMVMAFGGLDGGATIVHQKPNLSQVNFIIIWWYLIIM